MVGGTSVVVSKQFSHKLVSHYKSVVVIDAGQPYPCPCGKLCQQSSKLVGILMRRQAGLSDRTRLLALKTWSCVVLNILDLIAEMKASIPEADRSKVIASVFISFVLVTTLSFHQFSPCQEVHTSATEVVFQRGFKERELGKLRQKYKKKDANVTEVLGCELKRLYKTGTSVTTNILE